MVQKVFFSAVKNEGPFLLEWIAYHRAIGFDRMVIYSNDCTDGSHELLEALAQAGIIDHHPRDLKPGQSAQVSAAQAANAAGVVAPGDWVIWLDADEFLNIHAGAGHLDDLLAEIGEARGMLIPWRIFGDGGNLTFPGRVLSEAFTRAARPTFGANRESKTLFRAGPGIEGFAEVGINRPRLTPGALRAVDFLTGSGQPLDGASLRNLDWLAGRDFAASKMVASEEYGTELAQVNHYCVRTPDLFRLKRQRGRGYRADATGAANTRHQDDFYVRHNRNGAEDRSILRMLPETEAELAALRALPGVAQAEALVARRTAGALARLEAEEGPVRRPRAAAAAAGPKDATIAAPERFELTLPEAEAEVLRAAYARARVILEYGSGGSTFVALDGPAEAVFAVESDADWARRIRTALRAGDPGRRVRVHHADIGKTGAWGKPVNRRAAERFHLYATGIWDAEKFRQPDVVLIDGRFRAACFMTVLLRTTSPVTVLFDDYTERPEYHWIEDYLTPSRVVGRMAIFEASPMAFPTDDLSRVVGAYADWR
ncbi:glycosyltransferase family 2 protein [Pseudooceanicola sp. CBS1P-1]|uniref:Glycosyltransferase family 2 protein n=1 Tax=Pseudooceanicola albus TaxID=2692189 RepID=A0A6L7G1D0_9RHOB|nr:MULTISPECIES: glycosyltransferase family 2 protein [Pseudooceanicola]MBT9383294.1 glycosyltransferase family 2 protein [Pseudooceanicola endophyticus]MXN16383.1 glycosyltransferase family 2 protein [Pseudooceanicola albus]